MAYFLPSSRFGQRPQVWVRAPSWSAFGVQLMRWEVLKSQERVSEDILFLHSTANECVGNQIFGCVSLYWLHALLIALQAITIAECDIYTYQSDLESDPFGEERHLHTLVWPSIIKLVIHQVHYLLRRIFTCWELSLYPFT